jgi:hypothetical protein
MDESEGFWRSGVMGMGMDGYGYGCSVSELWIDPVITYCIE